MTPKSAEEDHHGCFHSMRPSDFLRHGWCKGNLYAWDLDEGRIETDDRFAVDIEPDEYCMAAAVDEWTMVHRCTTHHRALQQSISRRIAEAADTDKYEWDWDHWQDPEERTLEEVLAVVEGAEVEILGPKHCSASTDGPCPNPATVGVMSSMGGYVGPYCDTCAQEAVSAPEPAAFRWVEPLEISAPASVSG